MTITEFINKIGFKIRDEDVKTVNETIAGIKNTAAKALGAIGIGFGLSAVNELIEEFGAVNNAVRSAVNGLESFDGAQQRILDGANRARTSYADMASYVSSLMQSNAKLFPLEDTAVFSETIAKLMKTAGRGNDTVTGVMAGFSQMFQRGAVDAETLNSLFEQSPEAVNLLAKQLGVSKTELLNMAFTGRISIADLKNAFLSASDEVNKAFSQVDMTVSDALGSIRNEWGLWLIQTDKTFGVTNALSKAMISGFHKLIEVLNRARTSVIWLSDKLGGMKNLIKLIAITAGTVFAALNLGKIARSLDSALELINKTNIKLVALTAVIILLALLVEDFVNFMQGNDSLFGSLLEKAGIDCDALRKKISSTWKFIQAFLINAWSKIRAVCTAVWNGISSFFAKHGDSIKSTVSKIWNIIKKIVVGIYNTVTSIFGKLHDFLSKHGEKIKTVLTSAWTGLQNAVRKAADIVKSAKNAVSNAIKSIKNAFDSLCDSIASVIGFFREHEDISILLGVAIGTVTALIIAYNAASIASAARTAASKVAITALTAKETLAAGVKRTLIAVTKLWSSTTSKAITTAHNLGNAIKALSVKEHLAAAKKKILTAVTAKWSAVTTVARTVAHSFGAAISFLTSPIALVIIAIGALIAIIILCVKHWDEIKAAASSAWEFIKSKWTAAGEWFNKKVAEPIKNAFTGLWNGIVSIVSNIKDAIVTGFTDAVEWIKSLPEQAIQWGKDIIDGIVNGIKGAVGKIGEAASGIADKIKSFLGFSEPDEGPLSDFHTYMPDMIALMANGITAGKDKIRRALGGLSGDMSVMAKANIVSGHTAGFAAGGSMSGKYITQNVEINNRFEGDRAGQQRSAEAMDKAAGDATSELARGLAYVR